LCERFSVNSIFQTHDRSLIVIFDKTIMKRSVQFFILSISLLGIIFSCEKPGFIENPDSQLEFSTDTVVFDTIFTTIGSTTANFRVFNNHNQKILINKLYLAGDEASKFRLNINGIEGNLIEDITIPANDSIYIFVEVTLDPNNLNDPMVIQDSVVFEVNGNSQDVDLIAFGQDVHLINGAIIGTTEWLNDKPYLVYNSMAVDTAETLTIHPGTRIHFHRRSSMIVYGSLKVLGSQEEPVSFLGDRLEDHFDNRAGQWGAYVEFENGGLYLLGGIHFIKGSHDNEIRHAVIKNAIKGIQVDSMVNIDKPTLILSHTRIENMTVTGIDARSTSILADNCLIANCGTHCVGLFLGGAYEFYHCTISNNLASGARTHPALVLNNFYVYEGQAYVYDLYNALFANCIIYGPRQMEIELWNTIDDVPVPGDFNYLFDRCVVKVDTLNTDNEDHWLGILKNMSPGFDSLGNFSYRLDTLSIAKDSAKIDYARFFPLDLDGNNRLSDDGPDIGAYERIEEK